jgi:hypothetical protein
MKPNAPRQFSFQSGRPPVVVPATPAAEQTTVADCRRMLHTAQVMQLNTARPRALRTREVGGVDAGDDQGEGMNDPRQLGAGTSGCTFIQVLERFREEQRRRAERHFTP